MTELTKFSEFTELEQPKYDLPGNVIGAAMRVHRVLGLGFLEAVYQSALEYELSKNGFQTQREVALEVRYEGVVVGNYFADLIVNEKLIVETKAIQAISKAHEAQLVNYLTATGIENGLLLNFGTTTLEFRRKFRTPKSSIL